MIKIENLKKHYKSIEALKGINLQVNEGEIFAYLGPNGAGKTTTIKILTGLTKLTDGKAYLNGLDIEKFPVKVKKSIGVVHQSINLDQELSVAENLDLHGRLFHMKAHTREEQIDTLLSYVGLEDRKISLVKNLSGGMKRRLMIARALLHSPKILFLDEPTVGLDANIRRRIWALIKKIQSNGTTIFLTTHYIEEAEFLADRVAFLDEGAIVAIDIPQNFMNQIGSWALDVVWDDTIDTQYFDTHESAKEHMTKQNQKGFTLRRVNLEDAFLKLTGKKVK